MKLTLYYKRFIDKNFNWDGQAFREDKIPVLPSKLLAKLKSKKLDLEIK